MLFKNYKYILQTAFIFLMFMVFNYLVLFVSTDNFETSVGIKSLA
jgi:hypothetical protein